jgi:hypothetical protein
VLSREQFIRQQIEAGVKLHAHDGVWWQEMEPFFYKPAVEVDAVRTFEQRPARMRALLGYSHAVEPGCPTNRTWRYMCYDNPPGVKYSLDRLSRNRRSSVRRGLSRNEVHRITNLEDWVQDLQEIVITAVGRTGYGLPPEYYVKHFDRWMRRTLQLFKLPGREWWGTFHGGKLVAYCYGYQIDDIALLDTAKVHTDFLEHYTYDAVLFTLMEYLINEQGCRTIFAGGWTPDKEPLVEFKKKHNFQIVEMPAFLRLTPLGRIGLAAKRALTG